MKGRRKTTNMLGQPRVNLLVHRLLGGDIPSASTSFSDPA